MKRVAATLCGLALAGCASPPLESQQWISVETPNFRIASGADEATTLAIAERLEVLRAFLDVFGHAIQLEPRVPLQVLVFADSHSFDRFRPRSGLGGFMLPRAHRTFLVIDAGVERDGSTTALHEYVHFVLRNGRAVNYPPWYDEGLSELLSTVAVEEQHVVVGRIPDPHGHWVLYGSPTSLRSLMTARDVYAWSDRALGRFYAQAWATLHFFHVASRAGFPDRAAQLQRYIALVNRGLDPDAACERAFGLSFEALEAEFLRYLGQAELPYLGAPRDRVRVPEHRAARELAAAERDLLLGELTLALGVNARDAEPWFRRALEARPGDARALAGIGQALGGSDPAAAQASLERALELGRDDAGVQRAVGEALLERAVASESLDELRAARRAFERSIALDPDQVAAYAGLGRSYLAETGAEEVRPGVEALRTAHERLPANRGVAIALARLELVAGMQAHARRLLARLPAPTHGDPASESEAPQLEAARRDAGLPERRARARRHLESRLVVDTPEDAHRARGLSGWLDVSGRGGLWESTLHDVVIAIDESASTLVGTGSDYVEGETVIAAELEAARALVRQLDPESTRVAILTFAGRTQVRAPLGPPAAALEALDAYTIHLDPTGTSLAAALASSLDELHGNREIGVRRQRSIVLLSDGQPTVPSEFYGKKDALDLADRLGGIGIPVQAFALGEDALDDPEFYRDLAQRTDGRFVPVENPTAVVSELAEIRFTGLEQVELHSQPADRAGRAVRVFPDGSFDGFVKLVPGENQVTITATVEGGEQLVETRSVWFDRPEQPTPTDRARAEALRKDLEARVLELELRAEIARRRRAPTTKHLEIHPAP